MAFETREAERAYLNKFRRYLTQAGFTMADRVIECFLDQNPKWEKSGLKCPDYNRIPRAEGEEE